MDLTNYFIAEKFPIKTILVTKLSAGGAVSSLLGTYDLLPETIRTTIRGYILNDFVDGDELINSYKNLIQRNFKQLCLWL